MFGLGFGELVLILLIALIFIGPKKLPELAKGLGQGLKEFQKAAKGLTGQFQEEGPEPEEDVKKVAEGNVDLGGDTPIASLGPSEEKSKEEKPS